MPNRMLRDWTGSDKINTLSVQAERFFVRLIMKVDDYGCFYGDPRLLKANLFPLLLDEIRDADLLRWTAECQKAGLIVVYEENGKKFVMIRDFKQRLDKAKSKFPLPIVTDSLTTVPDFPAEEKGSRIEVEQKGREEVFTIEHCVVVALNDARWVKVNNATESNLKEFNRFLEGQGIYKKNPADYKRHYHNWKQKGGKPSDRELPKYQQSSGNPPLQKL